MADDIEALVVQLFFMTLSLTFAVYKLRFLLLQLACSLISWLIRVPESPPLALPTMTKRSRLNSNNSDTAPAFRQPLEDITSQPNQTESGSPSRSEDEESKGKGNELEDSEEEPIIDRVERQKLDGEERPILESFVNTGRLLLPVFNHNSADRRIIKLGPPIGDARVLPEPNALLTAMNDSTHTWTIFPDLLDDPSLAFILGDPFTTGIPARPSIPTSPLEPASHPVVDNCLPPVEIPEDEPQRPAKPEVSLRYVTSKP